MRYLHSFPARSFIIINISDQRDETRLRVDPEGVIRGVPSHNPVCHRKVTSFISSLNNRNVRLMSISISVILIKVFPVIKVQTGETPEVKKKKTRKKRLLGQQKTPSANKIVMLQTYWGCIKIYHGIKN